MPKHSQRNPTRRAPAPVSPEARRIRELREARGLSQREVADGIGVHQTAYSFWETGRFLTLARLAQLATFFGVPLSDVASEYEFTEDDRATIRLAHERGQPAHVRPR